MDPRFSISEEYIYYDTLQKLRLNQRYPHSFSPTTSYYFNLHRFSVLLGKLYKTKKRSNVKIYIEVI